MKSKGFIAGQRMRQVAEMFLGETVYREVQSKTKEGFRYRFSSEKGEVYFSDTRNYALLEKSIKNTTSEIKSIQISENIFGNRCRYILYLDNHPPYKELYGKIRHYKLVNQEWEELVAYLKAISIVDGLKYSSPSIQKPLIARKEEGLLYKPILEYMKGDKQVVYRLFDTVGYSQEEYCNFDEKTANFFSIATRLMYDDDYQVNLIGREVINCLIRYIE